MQIGSFKFSNPAFLVLFLKIYFYAFPARESYSIIFIIS